jgi:hypothetical protein
MPFASHEIEIVELLEDSGDLRNWLYPLGKTMRGRKKFIRQTATKTEKSLSAIEMIN